VVRLAGCLSKKHVAIFMVQKFYFLCSRILIRFLSFESPQTYVFICLEVSFKPMCSLLLHSNSNAILWLKYFTSFLMFYVKHFSVSIAVMF